MHHDCNEGAEFINEDYSKFYCEVHMLLQTDTLFKDLESALDREIRAIENTFTDFSLCLSNVTCLYKTDELSGINAKKFKKFESKFSEEMDKVNEGVSLIANIEDGDNPMLSKLSASFALDCLPFTNNREFRTQRS